MRTSAFLAFAAASAALVPATEAADWPQWRGPLRNGVAPESVPLLSKLPEGTLEPLWQSETIPSGDDGGLASPVIAGGRVFLSVLWHREVPTEERRFDDRALGQLGYQSLEQLAPEIVKKMEGDREALSPSLRGKKLDEWAAEWIEQHLDRKQKQLYAGYVTNRFRKGKLAIPLDVLEKVAAQKKHTFASEAELRQWVDAQGFSEAVREQVFNAVPRTRKVAEDVVVCLDLDSGKTLWKWTSPGEARGWEGSSTPTVRGDRVYATGSKRAVCLDAADGREIWSAELPQKPSAGSPLLAGDVLIVNAGKLFALDANTGAQRWKQDKAGGSHSSPAAYVVEGRTLILCNGGSDLAALDGETGEVVWRVPAGGDSSPAIDGEILAVQSRKPELGLVVYKLSADGAEKLWNHPIDAQRRQSSPVVYGGLVFLHDDDMQACFEAATGKVLWQEKVSSSITSPILVDGKLVATVNNGNTLQLVQAAAGEQRVELGRATIRGTWIPSPAIADGKLVIRAKDGLKCFNLAQSATAAVE